MPYFSISKIISHHFHVNKNEGDTDIGYGMIICYNIIVNIGLVDNFKCKVIEWNEDVVPMKDLGNFLGKDNLTKSNIIEVVM